MNRTGIAVSVTAPNVGGAAAPSRTSGDGPVPLGGPDDRAERGARADPELGEDPVEVRADGPAGQVQPLPDLAVGQPGRGQPGDLQLLGGELVVGGGRAAAAGLAGGAQLLAGPLGPRHQPERVEGVAGGAQ